MADPTPIQRKPACSCGQQTDVERLRTLADGIRRRLGAIDVTRHNLDQVLKSADEIVAIMERQEQKAA